MCGYEPSLWFYLAETSHASELRFTDNKTVELIGSPLGKRGLHGKHVGLGALTPYPTPHGTGGVGGETGTARRVRCVQARVHPILLRRVRAREDADGDSDRRGYGLVEQRGGRAGRFERTNVADERSGTPVVLAVLAALRERRPLGGDTWPSGGADCLPPKWR